MEKFKAKNSFYTCNNLNNSFVINDLLLNVPKKSYSFNNNIVSKYKINDSYFKDSHDCLSCSSINNSFNNEDSNNCSYIDVILSSDSEKEENKAELAEKGLYDLQFKSKIYMMIQTQQGSRKLQKLMEKQTFSQADLLKIYDEVNLNYLFLLMHKYANYFCQLLFKSLPFHIRRHILENIINSLPNLCQTSKTLCSVVVLFEKHLTLEDQVEIVKLLTPHIKYYSSISKILRVIEAIIGKFDQSVNKPIKEYVIRNIMFFKNSKDGFFMLKKLIKFGLNNAYEFELLSTSISPFQDFVCHKNGNIILAEFLDKLLTIESSKKTISILSSLLKKNIFQYMIDSSFTYLIEKLLNFKEFQYDYYYQCTSEESLESKLNTKNFVFLMSYPLSSNLFFSAIENFNFELKNEAYKFLIDLLSKVTFSSNSAFKIWKNNVVRLKEYLNKNISSKLRLLRFDSNNDKQFTVHYESKKNSVYSYNSSQTSKATTNVTNNTITPPTFCQFGYPINSTCMNYNPQYYYPTVLMHPVQPMQQSMYSNFNTNELKLMNPQGFKYNTTQYINPPNNLNLYNNQLLNSQKSINFNNNSSLYNNSTKSIQSSGVSKLKYIEQIMKSPEFKTDRSQSRFINDFKKKNA